MIAMWIPTYPHVKQMTTEVKINNSDEETTERL